MCSGGSGGIVLWLVLTLLVCDGDGQRLPVKARFSSAPRIHLLQVLLLRGRAKAPSIPRAAPVSFHHFGQPLATLQANRHLRQPYPTSSPLSEGYPSVHEPTRGGGGRGVRMYWRISLTKGFFLMVDHGVSSRCGASDRAEDKQFAPSALGLGRVWFPEDTRNSQISSCVGDRVSCHWSPSQDEGFGSIAPW